VQAKYAEGSSDVSLEFSDVYPESVTIQTTAETSMLEVTFVVELGKGGFDEENVVFALVLDGVEVASKRYSFLGFENPYVDTLTGT
jgi:hypothetical protein